MSHCEEADRLRTEIAEAKTKVKGLMGQIRSKKGRLRRIVTDAFNEESEPLNGITVEVREIDLGCKSCGLSPIGICVYSNRDNGMSLPEQRDEAAWHAKYASSVKWPHITACLFCGEPGKPEDMS